MSHPSSLFTGIVPAIVTPFTDDASAIDETALRRLVRFEIEAGVGGLIPGGSTGEFFSLSHEERRQLAEIVLDETGTAVPVAPHTGAMTTRETIELSKHAEDHGAAGVMIMPPYYEPLAWDEVLAHFQAVSDAVSIPVIYYHMPAASGLELTNDQFRELSQIENVLYSKDSSGNGVQEIELMDEIGDSLTILNGEDKFTFLALALGAQAGVWGSATFFPGLTVELYDALAVRKDLDAARQVWKRIMPILHTLGQASYQGAVKAGCEVVGISVGKPRLPIHAAPTRFYESIRAALRVAGVEVTA